MTSEITDSIDQSFVCGKSSVSRAELLWGFSAIDSGQHEQIADILGFERYPSRRNKQPDVEPDQGETGEDDAAGDQEPDVINELQRVTATSSSYYRITSRAIDQTQNHTGTDELSLPDWLTQASPTLLTETATRIPLCHQARPLYTELADWPRVLPFLQKVLGDHVDGRGPDTARLVKQVAKGEMIRRIPRKQRHGWSPKARILIDINDDNFPYRRDFMHLRDRLLQLRGDEGLECSISTTNRVVLSRGMISNAKSSSRGDYPNRVRRFLSSAIWPCNRNRANHCMPGWRLDKCSRRRAGAQLC
jgi:hypothetical protein